MHDVSCDFYEGCIHVIAGPSGSGKSTLLQVLNGLVPHINTGKFKGRVLMRGEDISDVPANLRSEHIGLVMQDPEGQFCTFTVGEEIAFGLENHCVEPKLIGRTIAEELDAIGLPAFEERSLYDMSGGQKPKISIASITAMHPDILLLDEPTANLDPINRMAVLSLIKDLARDNGVTVIMVEHNLEEIKNDIDRLLVLGRDGSVLADGGLEEVMVLAERGELDAVKRFLPRAILNTEPEESIWKQTDVANAAVAGAGGGNSSVIAADDALISIRELTFAYPLNNGFFKKTYGEPVLDGLSLDIRRGDFMVLAGENGAGKSTLMNAIFCVAPQQSGEVLLERLDVRKWNRRELYNRMGLVFQNPEMQFVTNQVDEELLYSFKQSELSDGEKQQRVDAMLEQFHLSEYSKKSPFILSQGQKRRLSVATMLLTGQQILFLDEPTYGQDSENKEELMADMLELNRQGMTIVFITHDEDLIRKYAKRTAYLDNGRIVMDGTADDYFRFMAERRKEAGYA